MSDRPTSGKAPRWGEYAPTPAQPPAAADPAATPAVGAGSATARGARGAARPAATASPVWDRVLTAVLLAVGTANVLTGIPTMLALPQVLDDQYRIQGFGDYTAHTLASAIGIVINVVSVLLLIATILFSIRRLRSGRIAFWVPIVGGAIALVVTGVLVVAAMLGDPAVPAYLERTAPTPAATSTP